ncbi:hypothetical protein [Notoacmeibacter ruber]|uniref:hypothetical protein n=1 Tax=Notoacmeibacter ruber TaxID=2670375 RepID=UPI0018F58EFF|nr:hypothetical protein [Notoacmeibacter ruber]
MALRLKPLALLAIGLVYGGGIGFTLAAANNISLGGHEHSHAEAAGNHAGVHDHSKVLNVSSSVAPALSATLIPDPVTGWNLHVETQKFRFAPAHAGQAHRPGEGHAHVYVNGEKLGRLYGPWMHIAKLPEDAVVEVTLNSNDHAPLAVDGAPLKVRATPQKQNEMPDGQSNPEEKAHH